MPTFAVGFFFDENLQNRWPGGAFLEVVADV
jgi:hypothetical protein